MEDAIFADDSVLFYVYKPNFDFKVGNKIVHTNKDGYIGEDFGEKTENKFRIAFVGSCGVAGSLHQPEYYSFCPILQQLFTQANSQVEILNCGIDGDYRSLELFKSIDYKVKKSILI
ncbi:MAG: hypothetical protein LUD02_01535 [Tannerellaceae bacterium]|nr:hypothetical protein [Tannerellaceae bacterium]